MALGITTQKPLVQGTRVKQGTNPDGPKSKKNRRKAVRQSKYEKKPEPQGKQEEKKVIPRRTKLPMVHPSVPGTAKTTLAKKNAPLKTDSMPGTQVEQPVKHTTLREKLRESPCKPVPEATRTVIFLPDGGFYYPILKPGTKFGAFNLPSSNSVDHNAEDKELYDDRETDQASTSTSLPPYESVLAEDGVWKGHCGINSNCSLPQYPLI